MDYLASTFSDFSVRLRLTKSHEDEIEELRNRLQAFLSDFFKQKPDPPSVEELLSRDFECLVDEYPVFWMSVAQRDSGEDNRPAKLSLKDYWDRISDALYVLGQRSQVVCWLEHLKICAIFRTHTGFQELLVDRSSAAREISQSPVLQEALIAEAEAMVRDLKSSESSEDGRKTELDKLAEVLDLLRACKGPRVPRLFEKKKDDGFGFTRLTQFGLQAFSVACFFHF
uniref:Uncharacterized protein n=1 Tax=Chromera velia CCMP2878 TaxID=1169474 RepID=A0A0G4FCC1_9ALVE|eukprot:Cvel_16306.t1-p1 / transcript=Cvel_16306.t1 / gene=Cvel_16306 / organism=Chromera_velia_CCMP2878 / gene_product=hypothetical protein / transcript_product=hypothetical protein / location=Cvel_scaffold1251:30023-30700(-) / protein_length=226 / sequence_SO=supercontig / SO=protein_coding / is_pseudo=false